jgi:hypothetical protein
LASNSGPYVQTAVLCETFIKGEQTHALSIINVIEGIGLAGPERDLPEGTSIGPPLKLIINLWAGRALGRFFLKLRPEAPSGIQDEAVDLGEVQFSGGAGASGVDTIVPMPRYEFTEAGTYWFDVLLSSGDDDDLQLLTRIPFTVTYQQTVNLRR